jgi:hypothetical protein
LKSVVNYCLEVIRLRITALFFGKYQVNLHP